MQNIERGALLPNFEKKYSGERIKSNALIGLLSVNTKASFLKSLQVEIVGSTAIVKAILLLLEVQRKIANQELIDPKMRKFIRKLSQTN